MIDIDQIPITEFTDPATIRLVSTAYIDEPAMQPLVDDDDELEFLEQLEGLTSSRQATDIPLPAGVNPAELLSNHNGYGWTYVNAAFCDTRSTGNRFNNPDRGAWYAACGDEATQTAQAEVSWHLTQELEATGIFENITAYRELIAGFTTTLHDLCGFADDIIFDPVPENAYPTSQTLAQSLIAQGSNGVFYPSVRYSNGLCLSAFRLGLIQNIRQGATWTFQWSGKSDPSISNISTP